MGPRLAPPRLALGTPALVLRPAAPYIQPPPRLATAPVFPSSRRTKWSFGSLNPFRRRGAESSKEGQELDNPAARDMVTKNLRGGIQHSIFDEPGPRRRRRPPGPEDGKALVRREAPAAPEQAMETGQQQQQQQQRLVVRPEDTSLVLDPRPRARVKWLRKKVIQMVRQKDRIPNRVERIARTERVMTFRSPWMATGVKKLGMLARQISGKTVEDALVQMRFSEKKFASEIAYNLREATDLAVVRHGMGLGRVPEPPGGGGAQKPGSGAGGKGQERLDSPARPVRPKPEFIQNKDGKWMSIRDPTRVYIDQAWVGRGPFRPPRIDYKGRGRHGVIRPPLTSISFHLKEEKTRVREFNEKKRKEINKKPWFQLPDKPIRGQRQYYCW